MSSSSTLNSRLRVLISKAYRAEKLYSSIRSSQSDRFSNPSVLAEIANDARAREWQRLHYQLRMSLNEILSAGASAVVAEKLICLRQEFLVKSQESCLAVDQGREALVETANRQEFAHAFKQSVELIRQKARAQASRVIVDELTAVLENHGRNYDPTTQEATASVAAPVVETELEPLPSNVIPLKRRIGARG